MVKCVSLLVLWICTSTVLARTVFYFPIVENGEAENTRFQTTIVLVNTGDDRPVKLEFFTFDGTPMVLSLTDLGNASWFSIVLRGGESLSAQTSGTGPLQLGYAVVTSQEGVAGVGGTAVLTRSDLVTRTTLYEAEVAASTSLTNFGIFADSPGVGRWVADRSIAGQVIETPENTQFARLATTDVPIPQPPRRIHYRATLSGAQEVPEVITGASGTLELDFALDLSGAEFELRVSQLAGVDRALIHCGPAGQNGPAVTFLFPGPAVPSIFLDGFLIARGTLTNADIMPRPIGYWKQVPSSRGESECGLAINNIASLLAAVKQGHAYVNVYTRTGQAGEIRGQISEDY